MNITMAMLPTLPLDRGTVDVIGVDFVGGTQYALGVLFAQALNGEAPDQFEYEPYVGYPQLGPHHVMDSMARDYALLPEDLTASTVPMNVCCVREVLPTCDGCGSPARYDVWPNSDRSAALLCESCIEPLAGTALGTGSATYVATLAEMPWAIRDICDRVTAELGRPSLWS